MIDSHCHLDIDPLFENINEVLARSKKIGISKIYFSNIVYQSKNKFNTDWVHQIDE